MSVEAKRDAKTVSRKELRQRVKNLTPAQRAEHSAQLCERLVQQPIWRRSRFVLLYVPLSDEPDIWPLVHQAAGQGKTVVLPRFSQTDGCYELCTVAAVSEDLVAGQFGILEPGAKCPVLPGNQLDFAVVPGIGFTLDGGRLGRGRGYYDRLLSQIPGFKCGVAFECQLVAELPLEPHDVGLNCILTPTRWHVV